MKWLHEIVLSPRVKEAERYLDAKREELEKELVQKGLADHVYKELDNRYKNQKD